MDLFKQIKTFKKGSAKDNSIKSYVICINKLHGDTAYDNLDFLKDKDKIMDKINDLENMTTRKNYLNAVCVSLSAVGEDNKFYLDIKREIANEYNSFLDKNLMTPKQEKNWLSISEMNSIPTNLFKEIKKLKLLKKHPNDLNSEEKMLIQDYLIGLLYTELPPIRLDYSPMKIISDMREDNNETNFLYIKNKSNKSFIINNFKNAKSKGKQIIRLPKKINKIVNEWLLINKSNHFLINKEGAALSENLLGKYISRVFTIGERSASLNILRHVVASDCVDITQTKKQKDVADAMCHSSSTQLHYAKYLVPEGFAK